MIRMKHVLAVVILSSTASVFAEANPSATVLVCSQLNAKQMPMDFHVPAMKFTGPAGDGRRGSAGFVLQSDGLIDGNGTRWNFVFQRAKSGFKFQIIHPFQGGHILVSLQRGVTIHRGVSWGDIGWGNSDASDKVTVTDAGAELISLTPDQPHRIASQLSERGEYQLWINKVLVCRHVVSSAKPLILEVPKERVWGGSSWDRTPFAGSNFTPQLQPGHAGLILGPMDGSGPTQNLQQIKFSRTRSSAVPDKQFAPLFARIADAREFERFKPSKSAGGGGGGPFSIIPDRLAVLVGFDYSTSTFYGGHLIVKSLRPIYQTPDGELLGRWHGVPHGKVHRVAATDGHVVAGLITKSGHRLDGMRVIFMRVKNGRLNPDDTYRSEWIGGHGGGPETQLAADGDAIIGLNGRRGHDLDAIGFLQVGTR
ncbi:MAG: hypothetical protein O3A00_11505 [Planctomycetota bacterium]|nr:hypothetical protein [Planctomycetota bacterium]